MKEKRNLVIASTLVCIVCIVGAIAELSAVAVIGTQLLIVITSVLITFKTI